MDTKLNKRVFEYGKWYLGMEDEEDEKNKGHYKLLAAENRAGQYKHNDIENQVVHLHGVLDKSYALVD
jgi:hypothetical protein